MVEPCTKIQLATKGKDADKLFEEVDELLKRGYLATETAVGQYIIDKRMNLHSFDIFLEEIVNIAQDYGPDTYYSAIVVSSEGMNFRCKDMGL